MRIYGVSGAYNAGTHQATEAGVTAIFKHFEVALVPCILYKLLPVQKLSAVNRPALCMPPRHNASLLVCLQTWQGLLCMPFQLDLSEEEDAAAASQLHRQDSSIHQQHYRRSSSDGMRVDASSPSYAEMLQTAGTSSNSLLLPLASAPGGVQQQGSHASSWVKHEACMLNQLGTSRAMQMMLTRRSSCGGGLSNMPTHSGSRLSRCGADMQHCWHSVQVSWLPRLLLPCLRITMRHACLSLSFSMHKSKLSGYSFSPASTRVEPTRYRELCGKAVHHALS
jgi:hypothetical protein